jgi:hypothetical protein
MLTDQTARDAVRRVMRTAVVSEVHAAKSTNRISGRGGRGTPVCALVPNACRVASAVSGSTVIACARHSTPKARISFWSGMIWKISKTDMVSLLMGAL